MSERPPSKPATLRLRVTATAETILRGGHPWLFAESIRTQNREGRSGELAVIFDRNDSFLAIGLFDPDSPLRVRVLHAGKPVTMDAAWWRKNFLKAVRRRDGLCDAQTNGYRMINGESDGWPGLVLDRYGTTLVVKLYTAAWLPRLPELVKLFRNVLPASCRQDQAAVDKSVPDGGGNGGEFCRQDAGSTLVLRLSRNIQTVAQKQFNLTDGQILVGEKPAGHVTFLETGLRFEADVVRGQKTGFFLDQRENRRLVESLARGCDVLNAFSFSGGFSLYAARGGAKSVTDLDISAHALESAKRNFALNPSAPNVATCRHETIQTDVFDWLEKNAARKFDLVILDPPSLAKRESERAGAIAAYGKLTTRGIKLLRPGGVLLAASCSAHVSAPEFFDIVRSAARATGKTFEDFRTTGQPPDHPATFTEAEYLKAVYLRFAETAS